MKMLLIIKYHWEDTPEMIVTLTDDQRQVDKQPTRANILKAMKWLVQDAKPGDRFFFHYSGHGSQLPIHGEAGNLVEINLGCI